MCPLTLSCRIYCGTVSCGRASAVAALCNQQVIQRLRNGYSCWQLESATALSLSGASLVPRDFKVGRVQIWYTNHMKQSPWEADIMRS
jgi:hypothetical protein